VHSSSRFSSWLPRVVAPTIALLAAAAAGVTTYQPALGATPPDPPTNVAATAGIGSATITWTAPASSGTSPLTSYTITSSAGPVDSGIDPAATSAVFPGLTNVAQTFTMTATSNDGTSVASTASNSVTPLPGGTYNPLTPARVIDTRNGTGGVPVAKIGPNGTLTFGMLGQGGVPATNVSAVILNVTVTDTTAYSDLTVWPAGTTMPNVSSLNWIPGETIPNQVEVALGSGGAVNFNNVFGATNLVVDVEGWVGDKTNSYGKNGLFNSLSPLRILDTRTGNGAPAAKLQPGQTINLQVAGRGGVPAATDAAAVVMNVTVTSPSWYGHLTVFPTGGAVPNASNLNFNPGETIPNRVTVPLGTSGQVSINNGTAGTVDVIADVNGWFTSTTSTAGGAAFVGITPLRLDDTRTSTTCGAFGQPTTPCPLPPNHELEEDFNSGITSLVMNVTATQPTAAGYFTVFPTNNNVGSFQNPPNVSDVNFSKGETIPNSTIVALGPTGDGFFGFLVFNAFGYTDVIMDVDGYYGPTVPAPNATTVAQHRSQTSSSTNTAPSTATLQVSHRAWTTAR